MNFDETLTNEVKILKKNTINFSPKPLSNHLVARFHIISDTILQVLFFHPVVQYENYLICIFMNINRNLKMRK